MVADVHHILTRGKRRIMDIQPTQLHERLSDFMGSENEVDRVTSDYAKATGQA
jgi:fructose-1,6-bisphosphatase I